MGPCICPASLQFHTGVCVQPAGPLRTNAGLDNVFRQCEGVAQLYQHWVRSVENQAAALHAKPGATSVTTGRAR